MDLPNYKSTPHPNRAKLNKVQDNVSEYLNDTKHTYLNYMRELKIKMSGNLPLQDDGCLMHEHQACNYAEESV